MMWWMSLVYFSAKAKAKYLKQLEGVLESCVISEHSVALARKAAQEIEARPEGEGEGIVRPNVDNFDEIFDVTLEELKDDSNVAEAIRKASSIIELKQLVADQLEAANEDHQENTFNDDDEDTQELVTTQQTLSLVDPISKTMMKDPVRHKICGHVYDRSSVTSMIKTSGKKGFRCPTMGCGYRKPLQLADMEDALDVRRQIMRYNQGSYTGNSDYH
ncbi:hypothetical protein Pcinc_019167 [Petrolisthes cinctipes]|uniref:E3 SUMO-protein ligase NSE2 n=1 Tax=Petrolisthes cinctipes TaxID=88211 RepID=A0AAE1FLR4_PETCI|nr:hypothetical protein Pcinc_019167 [Petrolisthes cinctipes]